jgi:endogenous inhibitor of DNA gyrase (YacG/DUF329 family)
MPPYRIPKKFGTADCPTCKNTFQKRRAEHTFCSKRCRRGDSATRLTVTCIICGNRFTVTGPRTLTAKFCGRACKGAAKKAVITDAIIAERFWLHVSPKSAEECWEWEGGVIKAGYGVLRIGKSWQMTAHRLSYTLHKGPIPTLSGRHGGCVCHRCDNRKCVNPNHLFLGTQRDNVYDQIAKGKMPWQKTQSLARRMLLSSPSAKVIAS